ncbi:MAG: hypothetical protein KDC93_15415, partial [Cyclobacteriaceae bacterium]|nr:hypothetical protein [Cyclobacteriaceae bacterium]
SRCQSMRKMFIIINKANVGHPSPPAFMYNFFAASLPQDSARSHLPSESLSGDSAENKGRK